MKTNQADWSCRYTEAGKNKGDLLEDDLSLMRYFGASGLSAVPGASVYLQNGGYVRMDTAAWNWLRPLLEELKALREKVDAK